MQITLFTVLAALSVTASEPSRSDYQQDFARGLPEFIEVVSFSIEASENVGNKVEPLYKARFKAIVAAKTDLFAIVKQDARSTTLRVATKKGDRRDVYGFSTARLYAGKWKVDHRREPDEIRTMGRPKRDFEGAGAGTLLIAGSPEEAAYRAQLERDRLAKQEAARAEAERAKQEAAEKRDRVRRTSEEARKVLPGTWRYVLHMYRGKQKFEGTTVFKSDATGTTGTYATRVAWAVDDDARLSLREVETNSMSYFQIVAVMGADVVVARTEQGDLLEYFRQK